MEPSSLSSLHKLERWIASRNQKTFPGYRASQENLIFVSSNPYSDNFVHAKSPEGIPQLDGCVGSRPDNDVQPSAEPELQHESGTRSRWARCLTANARRSVSEIEHALRKVNISASNQMNGPVPQITISPPSRTSLPDQVSGHVGEAEPVNQAHMIANRAGRVSYFTDRNFESLNVPPRAAPPNWQEGRLLPNGRGRKRTMTTKDLSVVLNPRRQPSRNRSSRN